MNSSPETSQVTSQVTSKTSQVTSPEALLDGLDDSQREAATALEGPVRIIACAGAGKTRTITRRIALLALLVSGILKEFWQLLFL